MAESARASTADLGEGVGLWGRGSASQSSEIDRSSHSIDLRVRRVGTRPSIAWIRVDRASFRRAIYRAQSIDLESQGLDQRFFDHIKPCLELAKVRVFFGGFLCAGTRRRSPPCLFFVPNDPTGALVACSHRPWINAHFFQSTHGPTLTHFPLIPTARRIETARRWHPSLTPARER